MVSGQNLLLEEMSFDIYSDHNGVIPGTCLPSSVDITDVLQNLRLVDTTS